MSSNITTDSRFLLHFNMNFGILGFYLGGFQRLPLLNIFTRIKITKKGLDK